jgi:hypothetical protein
MFAIRPLRSNGHRWRSGSIWRVLLEGVAVVMGLDAGHQRVELIFANGRLRQWWTHSEKRSPRELAELDADAAIHAAAVRYDPRPEAR